MLRNRFPDVVRRLRNAGASGTLGVLDAFWTGRLCNQFAAVCCVLDVFDVQVLLWMFEAPIVFQKFWYS